MPLRQGLESFRTNSVRRVLDANPKDREVQLFGVVVVNFPVCISIDFAVGMGVRSGMTIATSVGHGRRRHD